MDENVSLEIGVGCVGAIAIFALVRPDSIMCSGE